MLYKEPQSSEDRNQEELNLKKREHIIDSFIRNNQRLTQAAIEFTAMRTYAVKERQEISEAIERVNRDCCTIEEISFHKHHVEEADLRQFEPERRELAKKIDNRSDVRILLDSYCVKKEKLQEYICFVTIDREDIITNRGHIEKNLVGLKVKEPSEFNATPT
ncbi:MAG: hypothetical protein WBZ42_03540 [Halobacteriota archaeon]